MTVELGPARPDDYPGVEKLLRDHRWDPTHLQEGDVFVAREGEEVIGCVRLIPVGDGLFHVDDVLLREDRRGRGTGSELMRRALDSRDGKFTLQCHDERVSFYRRLGFTEIAESDLPDAVRDHLYRVGDLPDTPDHVHHIMRR